jgi:hypothetical protein
MVATGVAFAVTEHLKLQPSPIRRTRVTKLFSPTCHCNGSKAVIFFSLRRSELVSTSIVNPDDNDKEVRVLTVDESKPKGRLRVVWNGRDNADRLAPSGNYKVLVHLAVERRWITLPNIIRLDTKAPEIKSFKLNPNTISPDGDGNNDVVHIKYRLSERASVLLYVDGKLAETTRYRAGKSGRFDWKGAVDQHTLTGWHSLTLRARDLAGNVSKPTEPISVRLRILKVRPTRIKVAAGSKFTLAISTDRDSVRWRFDGGIGLVRSSALQLSAPSVPGRYRVVIRSGPNRVSALVIVR